MLYYEFEHMAQLTIQTKLMLRNRPLADFVSVYQISELRFVFLPEQALGLFPKTVEAATLQEWFDWIKQRGLQDIQLLNKNFTTLPDPYLRTAIVCYYKSSVTYWTAQWLINRADKTRQITYTEHLYIDPPSQKPRFEDNTDSLKQALSDISAFAETIGFPAYAKRFLCAKGFLDRTSAESVLPLANQNLFDACSEASVFGGMGTWSDSPLCYADQMGLTDEYERLTALVINTMSYSLIYAVNEF